MSATTESQTEIDALAFADAVLRIWGRNLDLTALVIAGYKEIRVKDYPTCDPFKSAVSSEIRLEEAQRGAITPAAEKAKLDLIRALLHVWFKVQRHLQNQVFVAVRELAVKRSEDPDQAQIAANLLLTDARHVEEVFAEKRLAVMSEKKRREKVQADAALGRLKKVLAKETLKAK